ncbi:MAG: 23S rRNA (pseudouridine(1915)-N(3))-methyltransferase RlmH [Rhizobiales bacterium PAR1]|nr:MAG: 23S rRNA (pseudouridine(1915)-N(3))-methyltransferase RlmH [Rhizobiales bacterium PAR1]
MKLDVVAIGRLKAGPERELVGRYAERLKGSGRAIGFDGPRLVELSESQARRDLDRKAEEAAAILAQCPESYRLIAFDEGGAGLDSAGFAKILGEWRDSGVAGVSFVIGGADGLGEAVRARAALTLAFGRMTMPHQIVRALVLEQLYRAATILSGHPYHRV